MQHQRKAALVAGAFTTVMVILTLWIISSLAENPEPQSGDGGITLSPQYQCFKKGIPAESCPAE